jgi:hypothetical protein
MILQSKEAAIILEWHVVQMEMTEESVAMHHLNRFQVPAASNLGICKQSLLNRKSLM